MLKNLQKLMMLCLMLVGISMNANAWKFTSASPAVGEVEQITSITINFSGGYLYEFASQACTISCSNGSNITVYLANQNPGSISLDPSLPFSAITNPGTYTLTIPANTFHQMDSNWSPTEGNEAQTFTWTIPDPSAGGGEEPGGEEPGGEEPAAKDYTLTYESPYITLTWPVGTKIQDMWVGGLSISSKPTAYLYPMISGNVISIYIDLEDGNHTLNIDAGRFSINGGSSPAISENFTVGGEEPGGEDPGTGGGSSVDVSGMVHFYDAEAAESGPLSEVEGIGYSATSGGFMSAPAYQTYGGKSLWIYNKNTVTFTAPTGKLIDRIVFKTIEGYEGAANVNCGSFDKNTGVWEKADGTTSVTFTVTDNMHATDIYVNILGDAPAVTVSSACWATHVLEGNASFVNSGLKAYAVSGITGSYINFTEVTEATTGDVVLVESETAGTFYLNPKSDAVAPVTNLLTSSPSTTYVSEANKYYILANGGNGIGFYPVQTGTYISANKGYLVINGGLASYRMSFGEATDIKGVILNKLDGTREIYDLNGQRLQQMKRGVNIVNGKKILNK